jgi:hypothetical protein
LDIEDEGLENAVISAIVYFTVDLLEGEGFLLLEQRLEELDSAMVEDVPTCAGDEDLGQKFTGNGIVLVDLQVITQVLYVFAEALGKVRCTFLNLV